MFESFRIQLNQLFVPWLGAMFELIKVLTMDFKITMIAHQFGCVSQCVTAIISAFSRVFSELLVIEFKASPVAFGAGLFFHSTASCKLISLQHATEFERKFQSMIPEEKLYVEMYLRWLQAKRDYPTLNVGPEPELLEMRTHPRISHFYDWQIARSCLGMTRNFWIREFNRSFA